MGKAEVILDIATSFFVFFLLTLAFHEFCHYTVLILMGGKGYVIWTLMGGLCVITKTPPTLVGKILTLLSGGLGCGLLYTYFYFWWLEEPADRWVKLVCFGFMISQYVYGVFECLLLIVY